MELEKSMSLYFFLSHALSVKLDIMYIYPLDFEWLINYSIN